MLQSGEINVLNFFAAFRELKDVVEEEEISFIESNLKGLIIGKGRKGLIGLGETTGASLFMRGSAIWVFGTQCQRDKVKAIIYDKIVCMHDHLWYLKLCSQSNLWLSNTLTFTTTC